MCSSSAVAHPTKVSAYRGSSRGRTASTVTCPSTQTNNTSTSSWVPNPMLRVVAVIQSSGFAIVYISSTTATSKDASKLTISVDELVSGASSATTQTSFSRGQMTLLREFSRATSVHGVPGTRARFRLRSRGDGVSLVRPLPNLVYKGRSETPASAHNVLCVFSTFVGPTRMTNLRFIA